MHRLSRCAASAQAAGDKQFTSIGEVSYHENLLGGAFYTLRPLILRKLHSNGEAGMGEARLAEATRPVSAFQKGRIK
jgi:hypothetical protein